MKGKKIFTIFTAVISLIIAVLVWLIVEYVTNESPQDTVAGIFSRETCTTCFTYLRG